MTEGQGRPYDTREGVQNMQSQAVPNRETPRDTQGRGRQPPEPLNRTQNGEQECRENERDHEAEPPPQDNTQLNDPQNQTESQRKKSIRNAIRVASLNMKGRGSYATQDKWMHVHQTMRDNHIGILALQETHLDQNTVTRFNSLFGRHATLKYSMDPETPNARGVAIVVSKKIAPEENVTETDIVPGRAIMIQMKWHDEDELVILVVYAPNVPTDNRKFWEEIVKSITNKRKPTPDIVLGDCNIVEDALDRSTMHTDNAGAVEALQAMKERYNLIDGWRRCNEELRDFSFHQMGTGIRSRIDRIYVNAELADLCDSWRIETPAILSDHRMVSVDVSSPIIPHIGRGRWAIPPYILKDKELKVRIKTLAKELETEVTETAGNRTAERNPQKALKTFKTKLKEECSSLVKKRVPQVTTMIKKLEDKQAQVGNDPKLTEEDVKIITTKLQEDINALVKKKHEITRKKVAARNQIEGEKIGRYWSNLNKSSAPRDTIMRLKIPGSVDGNHETRSKNMAKIARDYHNDIQYSDRNPKAEPPMRETQEMLGVIDEKIPGRTKTHLAEYIKKEEVREALKSSKNGKAPGLDGIPAEVWKRLEEAHQNQKDRENEVRECDIVNTLTKIFNDIERHGLDKNTDFNEGWMCPLYKKKDRDDISNYRPITVLNTDYKIFTKVIANRLAEAVPHIVHRNQAGFIKGRSIYEQVKLAKLSLEYAEAFEENGALVALDQEKAYDKIIHKYLWKVLEEYGFPFHLIDTIKALYNGATTTVVINGMLSAPFEVVRGVRQGDAMSCLLFDLAIEPLATALRKSEAKGLQIPGMAERIVTTLFADDTTVYLSEEDNFGTIQKILTAWCKVSGAKFNEKKTEVIPMGNPDYRTRVLESRKTNENAETFPEGAHIAADGEPVRILGAWLGNGINEASPWGPILEKITDSLERWDRGHPTTEGRRHIIQMVVAGTTQYLTRVQGMPANIAARLEKVIRDFSWPNESKPTVSLECMRGDLNDGGRKIFDLPTRNKAIDLVWLKEYLTMGENRPTWARLADELIKRDIPKEQNVALDNGAVLSAFLQAWKPRERKPTKLPDDLWNMLKAGKEEKVKCAAVTPSRELITNLPAWYHPYAQMEARKIYNSRNGKCLRKHHQTMTVGDLVKETNNAPASHNTRKNACTCEWCREKKNKTRCEHPIRCYWAAKDILMSLDPNWSPIAIRNGPLHDPKLEDVEGFNREQENQGNRMSKMFNPHNESMSIEDTVRIFTKSEEIQALQPEKAVREELNEETIVYTDGSCTKQNTDNAAAGSGVWFGLNDERNMSLKVPGPLQTNQVAELFAILQVAKMADPNKKLEIRSDSKFAIDGLTKHLSKWESIGWLGVRHEKIFKCIVAWLRRRNKPTILTWVKGHAGIHGNEMADQLAGQGTLKQSLTEELDLSMPAGLVQSGAQLNKMTQKLLYKGIRARAHKPIRSSTNKIIDKIKESTNNIFAYTPDEKSIWRASRSKDIARNIRDFIWKSTHNSLKVGEYWRHITGYEERGICEKCGETDSMEHILCTCVAPRRRIIWQLANELWKKKGGTEIEPNLGSALGCGLSNFSRNGRQLKGKNRLYRIIISESMYMIWKLRCEEQIGGKEQSEQEIHNRWVGAINHRLSMDCILTDRGKFGKGAIAENLVKSTWRGCIKDEEGLHENWPRKGGVLVGIDCRRYGDIP